MIAAPRVLILSSSLDSAPREIVLQRPMTVGEIVAAENVSLDLPTIAVLTDPLGQSRPVMRGQWHLRMVQPGDQLAFVPVPGRGSLTSILAAVAGIALAVFAPWAAGLLANTFFGGSLLAKSLIGGAIMIAGQFIINRLLGPQTATAESVFSVRASSNQARPLEPIPALYGLMRYAPPYAARPYAEYVDNDQYLYQLHCLTIGHGDPLKWEIGETLVWTKADGFSEAFQDGDTEIEIIRPGQQIKLFPANVVSASTVDGQQVPDAPGWLGPFAVSAPGIKVSRIVCDYIFPLGLVHIDKKGRGVAMTRTVKAEYREINDAGAAIGNWKSLIDFEHRAATRTPQRFSRGLAVTQGRYEVRFGATGTDQSDNTGATSTLNRVLWAGLRGYVEGFVTPPDCTLVATKIRATENLSREASGQYLWTVQRLLPVWSEGGGWSVPVATRSPAWAAADLLARLDVPDTDYDLGWLKAYSTVWETRGDRFDGVFERRWQASEALDAILRVGRSYHVRLGWMIGFNRDEPKQVRRMAFGPDSVVRGSIQREDIWFSEDQPDSLKVIYLDGETWREREVMAAIGAVGDDKPEEMPAFGVTNYDHAWREGIFTAAENAFRRSFRTFQVEREGRMLVRGDPVVLHDPLLDVVVFDDPDSPGRKIDFARLIGRAGDTLTLDRQIEVEPGETYHLALRDRFGREWGPCLVQSIAGNTLVLNAADRHIVEGQHGQLVNVLPDISRAAPAHVTLLKGDYRLFDGLVVEARPVGPELWDVTIVNDDQRVHAVDETEVTPAPWTPPPMITPPPDKPIVKGVYGVLQQGTLSLTLEAGWQAAPGADRYIAEMSYDDDALSSPTTASWTPVHDSRATRFSVGIMPQAVTLRVAGIGKMQGPWAYASIVDVPELRLPPEIEDPIKQELEQFTRDALIEVDERITEIHEDLVNETIILAGQIGDEAAARANQIHEERDARLLDSSELSDRYRALYETVARTAFALTETTLDTRRNLVIVNESIASVDQSSRAFAQDQIQLAVGPGSAVAERLATIEATATSNYDTLSGSISTVQSVLLDAVGDEATARQALAIQLRGNYGGADLAHVTEGLIHQLNQVVISETMALANAIAMVSAGVGIMFDWSRIWLFDSSVHDWTGNGAPTVNQGWLRPADHATEPYVVSPPALAVDGAAYKQVKLYTRKTGAPTWRGQLWWQAGGDTTWDAARRVTVAEPSYDADGRAVVTIDVAWTGTINRIRLDLSTAQTPGAYYEVDWVAIGRPSPGASQAQVIAVQSALASDIMAEAASRQALSVKLTGEADPTGVTLGNLSSGLIYDERQARVTADNAAMSIITGVLAQLADPATGLDALAQAQSTMATSIAILGNTVTLQGESIDDIYLALDGLENEKASVGITDALQAQIDELGGGNSLRLIAEAVRALRLTVDRLALGNAGTWLAAKKDRGELGDIIADVNQQMSSRIDIADDKITLQASLINQIRLDLGGYATLNAMMALTGRVTATEDEIDQLATAMLAAQNELAGKASNSAVLALTGRVTETESELDLLQSAMLGVQGELAGKASNSAVLALTGRMTEAEGDIDALSTAMLSTQAAVGKVSANGALLIEAGATPGDGWSRIALRTSANSGVTFEEAAILLDSRTSGTVRSRIVLKAAQTSIMDGAGNLVALFGDDGITMERIRLGTLKFDQLQSNNGKLIMRGYGSFADLRLFT